MTGRHVSFAALSITVSTVAFAASAQTATPAVADARPVQSATAAEPQGGSPVGLADIIVTANRRSENVQDVPASITALQGDTLTNAVAFRTQDLVKFVPTLTIVSALNETQPNFTLRGIGVANQFEPNQVSPVGVYTDDIYQSSPTTHGQQLYDLSGIEVLRGPQGTLYGKNTTGGAINFISNKPELQGTKGYLSGGYGSFDRVAAEGAIELTPVEDQVGIRVATNFVKSDGYVKNVVAGAGDLSAVNSLSVRGTLRVKPTPDLDIRLKGYYSRNRSGEAGGTIVGTAPDGSYSLAGLTYNRSQLGFHQQELPNVGFVHGDSQGVDLHVAWEASEGFELTSITSLSSGTFSSNQDIDGSPLEIIRAFHDGRFSQHSQELRARITSITDLDVVVGGFYGYDRMRDFNRVQIGFALPFVSDPANGVPPIDEFLRYRQIRKSFAGFAQGIYSITPELKLTLGARFTHDITQITDVQGYLGLRLVPGGPIVPAINTVPRFGPYDPTQFSPGLRNTENRVTGVASLAYAVSDDVNIYGSYSRGYRAGANTAGPLSISQLTYLPPEQVDAFEVGLKSELLDRRLRLNLAAYYYDYQNLQVQEIVAAQTFAANAGPAKIYGLDVESTLVVTDRLRVGATVGLFSGKYSTNGALLSGSVKGNHLPFAPKFTFRPSADWTAYEGDSTKLLLHADANYQSKVFFSPLNADVNPVTGVDNTGLFQNGYWLVDASASLKLMNEKLELGVWAKNLLDKDYYSLGVSLRGVAGFSVFAPGSPRTYGVSAKVVF
ncbi:TonB-dependent receptor [Sphingobium sp. CR2-8]|uniref:TonB-dependent receptor n=1 Tax=Sphingobium sp. CR2-8 TaxID=1306534 RepID=UPI002DBB3772|nr:TonB-dependent receptor [Sphingobium sp. CR2-8]MEC3909218.1 TonB-dependent receptor [Sphingobium sp. CR2-8]